MMRALFIIAISSFTSGLNAPVPDLCLSPTAWRVLCEERIISSRRTPAGRKPVIQASSTSLEAKTKKSHAERRRKRQRKSGPARRVGVGGGSLFRMFEDTVSCRISDAASKARRLADNSHSSPVVCAAELSRLSHEGADTFGCERDVMIVERERRRLVEQMQDNGGYLIVELDGENVETMYDMWMAMENLYHDGECKTSRRGDKIRIGYQSFTRKSKVPSDAESHPPGCHFVETRIRRRDGALVSPGVGNLLSTSTENLDDVNGKKYHSAMTPAEALLKAHLLLSKIAKEAATVVLMAEGSDSGIPPHSVAELMRVFPDDGTDLGFAHDGSRSSTIQRLLKYSDGCHFGSEKKGRMREANVIENLKSHADRTLSTAVPVSAVAGLEIWHTGTRSWVRPELACGRRCAENAPLAGVVPWNCRYVVVMAGKWIEILTRGTVLAAVHRVVVLSSSAGPRGGGDDNATRHRSRMSAPLFLNPRRHIAVDVRSRFGRKRGAEGRRNNQLKDSGVEPSTLICNFLTSKYAVQHLICEKV